MVNIFVRETETFLRKGIDMFGKPVYNDIKVRESRTKTDLFDGGESVSIEKNNGVVPQNVKRIIAERGLRQSAVAEWAGFSKQQFNDMLRGRKVIKPCDIMAISNALGVSVLKLFATEEKKK